MNSRYAIMVSPCMLAPGLQAEYNFSVRNWGKIFIELAMDYNIDIFPFLCVESMFVDLEVGLKRNKHGIDYYSRKDGYIKYCKDKALEVSEQIIKMEAAGYIVLAIVGVEHSPNCAVNYLYSHSGMQKRAGLFIDELKKILKEQKKEIIFIGINRKYPSKAKRELEQIFASCRVQGG